MDRTADAHLNQALTHWRELVARPAATPADLTANLKALYQAVYTTDFAALDVAEVTAFAAHATDDLFDFYLRLRDRLPEWHQLGLINHDSALALRDAMRVIRYTIDIIGEVAHGYPKLARGEATHMAFEGPPQWTSMHPALTDGTGVDFRSGDVILVRGRLHNSAAIARIGDADSQFSHVGIVYIDSYGHGWLVEALIEDGATLTPLDTALGHGLGRAVVFRHRDRALARRAAEQIEAKVSASRQMFGRWIPYDFSMELSGPDRLFCSKLVREAYAMASQDTLLLPSFGTRLTMTNRDFFERIGVTAFDTFAPADIEVEPAFDLVAEWRDYRVTPALRLQDLLMSKLFDWMDGHGYMFRENLRVGLLAYAGRLVGLAAPNVVKDMATGLGIPKVPRNMTARTISTIAMLHETAEPILRRLMALEAEQIKSTGRPLHPRDVQAELERLRENSGGRIGFLTTA